jgi:hypothetical protein
MPHETLPFTGGPNQDADNRALCAELSLLFLMQADGLRDAILKIGGRRLAYQFDWQLNDYALKHAWSTLTGLADLAELRQKTPDVDAKMLLSVYLSLSQYARTLAKRILGTQILRSTQNFLRISLSPYLAELNARYPIIPEC